MNKYIEEAKKQAQKGIESKSGGPFGAVIVDKNGQIIAKGHNEVLSTKDPTAHAEIVAIRKACEKIGKSDLSEYTIYSSCEPCPMCLSAIIWANIKKIYYGGTRQDAAKIGFRDDAIYEYIKGENKELLKTEEIDRKECKEMMESYHGEIY